MDSINDFIIGVAIGASVILLIITICWIKHFAEKSAYYLAFNGVKSKRAILKLEVAQRTKEWGEEY